MPNSERFTLKLMLLSLLAMALWACSSIDTDVQPAPGFRAADYRTYSWASPPLRIRKDQNANAGSDQNLQRVDEQVRTAVDAELQRRGFQRVDNNAAALIDYRIGSQMTVSQPGINSPRDEADKMWDLNRASATDTAIYNHPTLPYVESAELWLTLKSVQSGTVVWQGKSSTVIDSANPGKQVDNADIKKAVAKLIAKMVEKH
ncbi:MAG TPA: DUF4136 domain-containing protein [Spongiibacteraceae bacterium]|jgi:hypothetical protein